MNVTKSSQISNIGKFLDQPKLTHALDKYMPPILIGTGTVVAGKDIYETKKEDRPKAAVKNIITMFSVIGSSLLAVKGLKIKGKQILPSLGHSHCHHPKTDLKKEINDYLKIDTDPKITKILNKAKEKALSLKQVSVLRNHLNKSEEGKDLFNKIIPPGGEDLDAFEETGRLSILGLIPVIGGVAGGTLGDRLTDKNWKEKVPDKIKEGAYQYLANIFLCNVGAGAALLGVKALEKHNVIKPSKPVRLGSMIAGVVSVGILGGSAIANAIGQKVINPIFDKKSHKNIYKERKPDLLDASLHVDDMASVGVLSGFKWVEPALPFLYSISGYRAGIGYRNNGHHRHKHRKSGPQHSPRHNHKQLSFEHNHRVNNKIFEKFHCKETPCQNYQQA